MRDWKVFSLTTEDDIAVVVFDVPGSPVNTWNISRQLEWEAVTDELLSLERSGAIKAVVMVSGKPGNFLLKRYRPWKIMIAARWTREKNWLKALWILHRR